MFKLVVDLIHIFRTRFLDSDSPWINPFVMEVVFWAALIPLVVLLWKWQPAWIGRLEQRLVAFSRRKALAVVFVGLLALGLRLAILPIKPIPSPAIHDEFSYLMQAQTFNSGRLTNPPHPMGVHFETFHVNMLPTYQAMYPPGQAAFLALGMRLLGDPWYGVLLGVALMCAAITWMLQGWMPSQWALLGGIFCVLRFAAFEKWIDTYYGGGVAALGGALVLGAIPRLRACSRPLVSAFLFALGLVLMANTRQYEGFVFSIIPFGWLVYWLFREGKKQPALALKVVAIGLLVLVPAGAFMLYYNFRGTGSALTTPYMINQETYHITKPFLWQERYPLPDYRHFEMKRFYTFHELPDYLRSRELWGLKEILLMKGRVYYSVFLWPLLIAAVPAAWVAMKSRRLRMLVIIGVVMLVALASVIWQPEAQYPAPAMAVLVAMMLLCVRLARTVRVPGRGLGIGLSRAMVIAVAGLLLSAIGYGLWNPYQLVGFSYSIPPDVERARIMNQLSRGTDKHLIIVRRRYQGRSSFEWVYNEADIDASKVVWARDMGDELNQALVDYYRDRQVWVLDGDDVRISQYRPSVPTRDELVQLIPSQSPGKGPGPLPQK